MGTIQQWRIRAIAMSTSNNDEVITWYAFQCPKSNREYFYEPISGMKTWTLPTSELLSPVTKSKRPQKKPVSVIHQLSSHYPSNKIEEEIMGINNKYPTKLGLVIVVTLIVSLMCNTVFLVVLVKMSDLRATHAIYGEKSEEGHNHKNTSTPQLVYTKPEIKEITVDAAVEQMNNELAGDVPETSNGKTESNSESKMTIDEEMVDDISQANTEVPTEQTLAEKDIDYKVTSKQTGRIPDRCNTEQKTENIYIDGETFQGNDENAEPPVQAATNKKTNKELNENTNIQGNTSSQDKVPPQCWVPFAYLINPRCRRNNAVGLNRPLFDAEHFVRAMI